MESQIQVRKQFIERLESEYPQLKKEPLTELISENLISPIPVSIPQKALIQAQDFASAIEKLRNHPHYLKKNTDHIFDPGNRGIFNSYDFHLNKDGELKLIEANTNASFWILSYWMYLSQNKSLPFPVSTERIREDILQELKLAGFTKNNPRIAIIDENPSTQRLYIEFLIYKALFESWGWTCDIRDYREDLTSYDFVYNRFTDFLLQQPESLTLKKLCFDKKLCLSPHPLEYFLIADKNRMVNWRDQEFLSSCGLNLEEIAVILKTVPASYVVTKDNTAEIWAKRKELFFKPLQGFGSKQTFKGASISHKVFDDMMNQHFLAQENIPAPEISYQANGQSQNYKYDLRFYFYRGEIEHLVARTYQGQVTNLRTEGGGFSCVEIN